MKCGKLLLGVMLVALAVECCQAGTFISTDRAGYTGTWTRYNTLADAQAGVNAVGASGTIPQRDLALYIGRDAAGLASPGFENSNLILTNWSSGAGNPSNANYGFFQIYDTDGSTGTAFNASWSGDLQTFHLQVSGANANAADTARFGEILGGPASATAAVFHQYALDAIFGGFSATYNPVTGLYEATGFPTTIDGTLKGIVENVGSDPSRHGFYVFDLSLNAVSWAATNGHLSAAGNVFASSVVTPEPASLGLWSLMGAAGLAYRWRKQKRASA